MPTIFNTPYNTSELSNDAAFLCWMGLVEAPLSGYDTSREAFIGPYRSYHNPLAVVQGKCSNSNAYGDNSCGGLQSNLTLRPGESREVLILLGIGDARTVGKRIVAKYGTLKQAEVELQNLKKKLACQTGQPGG